SARRWGGPAILAPRDRRDMPAVEADQQEGRRDPVAARPHGDLRPPGIDGEGNRHFVAIAPRRAQRALDLATVGTDRLPSAVDDDLRRVDRGKTQKVDVAVLAPRRLGAGKRVLPAEP